ncbi:hypothetical protein L227DRAFT_610527 [Lentinus tigrinus ALCF2SS1-6]|uniref:Uncharacterized protein n=1 Tax=Lentinus tigrinus ALCF2SS1-6 TaxID=1328759 RepID=A0A5C2SEF6_9APHY|nr:hypothetical protein L227DRAFT_610527 [Lentinus tigrinus ALCF2SS1-6]
MSETRNEKGTARGATSASSAALSASAALLDAEHLRQPSTRDRDDDDNQRTVEANASSGMSPDDQAMSQAMEGNLWYNIPEDIYHELPLERLLHSELPTAKPTLRSSYPVWSSFLKHTIAQWLPLPEPGMYEMEPPRSGAAHQAWSILETYTNMHLARTSELNVDASLRAFSTEPWRGPAERPGDVSARFYRRFVYASVNVLKYNHINNSDRKQWRLLELQYGQLRKDPDRLSTHNLSVVRVNVGPSPDSNDLLAALAADLARADTLKNKAPMRRHVMFEPLENRRPTIWYPNSLYLDQFMRDTYELANQKRMTQRELLDGIKDLDARKHKLLHLDDKDIFADLQSRLYYYDNVADSNGNPKRAEEMKAKEKISQAIENLEEEVQCERCCGGTLPSINDAYQIDIAIEQAQGEAQTMLELQQHRVEDTEEALLRGPRARRAVKEGLLCQQLPEISHPSPTSRLMGYSNQTSRDGRDEEKAREETAGMVPTPAGDIGSKKATRAKESGRMEDDGDYGTTLRTRVWLESLYARCQIDAAKSVGESKTAQ